VDNPDKTSVKYEYDDDGNMVKMTDTNGNFTTFTYDLMNRVTKKTYSDGKYVTYAYDLAGLLTSKINARGTTTFYAYDKNHNLLTKTYDDTVTANATYTYDTHDRMTSANTETTTGKYGIGTYNYTYDANSRTTRMQNPWDNYSSIGYRYDKTGRTTYMKPRLGDAVNYAYNRFGGMSTISANTTKFSYGYSGADPIPASLTRWISGAVKSVTTYAYDTLDRLTNISNKNGSNALINSYDYTYTAPNGADIDLRTSETLTKGSPLLKFAASTETHSYNDVNQLTDTGYAYDADGNMTTWTANGITYTAYYDAENRLYEVTYNNGSNHTYYFYYSPDGLVAKHKVDNVETRFVRDDYLCLQERNSSNVVTNAYVWDGMSPGGIGGLLELKQSGSYYSYMYDGRGNVSVLFDGNNQVVKNSYKYDPFGVRLYASETITQPYQFSTQYYYPNLYMVKYLRRDYLPILGRWGERDPAGERADKNLYSFVRNSPANLVDPLGLWAAGFSFEFSTINPFSSGGGGSYGLNAEYTSSSGWHLYKYYTPCKEGSTGFLVGPSVQVNGATGTGDWTGPFESGAGSYTLITGGFFQTPPNQGDPGYFGGTIGLGKGPPGVGFTNTTYDRIW
jgi:RHS repeat-associated protein